MKAIVNVNKNSSFAHLNGLTFEVVQVLTTLFCLDINGTKTDFGHKEVVIVAFQKEMQQAYDDANWGYKNNFITLKMYAEANGITFSPQYNCQA